MFGFCKHDYNLLSETTTKSKFQSVIDALGGGQIRTVPAQMSCAERKFIQVFKCDKCFKIKRFVEDI